MTDDTVSASDQPQKLPPKFKNYISTSFGTFEIAVWEDGRQAVSFRLGSDDIQAIRGGVDAPTTERAKKLFQFGSVNVSGADFWALRGVLAALSKIAANSEVVFR